MEKNLLKKLMGELSPSQQVLQLKALKLRVHFGDLSDEFDYSYLEELIDKEIKQLTEGEISVEVKDLKKYLNELCGNPTMNTSDTIAYYYTLDDGNDILIEIWLDCNEVKVYLRNNEEIQTEKTYDLQYYTYMNVQGYVDRLRGKYKEFLKEKVEENASIYDFKKAYNELQVALSEIKGLRLKEACAHLKGVNLNIEERCFDIETYSTDATIFDEFEGFTIPEMDEVRIHHITEKGEHSGHCRMITYKELREKTLQNK